ncbi:hypothetical protein PMAYCL1PPCAC_27599, partial [Pristionchus mayeri]
SSYAYAYIHEAPTRTKRSSFSGDFLEVTTQRSSIKTTVKSSSITAAKDTISVGFFRGGGADPTTRSTLSTITSSLVYCSLFSREIFPKVFNRVLDNDDVEAKFVFSTEDLSTIELTVRDATKPFIVGNGSIAYFWDISYLPESGSADLIPSNEKRVVSYCNTTAMERCAAPINHFLHLSYIFMSTKRKQLTHFAWLCPQRKLCCAWECCEEYVSDRM